VFGFFSVSAVAIMTMTCFKPPSTRSHGCKLTAAAALPQIREHGLHNRSAFMIWLRHCFLRRSCVKSRLFRDLDDADSSVTAALPADCTAAILTTASIAYLSMVRVVLCHNIDTTDLKWALQELPCPTPPCMCNSHAPVDAGHARWIRMGAGVRPDQHGTLDLLGPLRRYVQRGCCIAQTPTADSASDLMRQGVHVEACCSPCKRTISHAADWAITTPLLLLDILLLAGLSIGDTLWILFADIAMIATGLFGALLPNRYKWGGHHMKCRVTRDICRPMAVAACCWHSRLLLSSARAAIHLKAAW
jgi:Bacteriorhodopsin-like protein